MARWIATSPDALGREITGLVISGDSAGGNLTIVTTHALMAKAADVPVVLQAPIYPVADDITQHESVALFGDGFLLTVESMAWFTEHYGGNPDDPRHTPMNGDCTDAPATVLCTAGLDPLRDSGRNYAAHLIQAGVDVTYHEFPGVIHGFITLRKAIPSAQADVEIFAASIKARLEQAQG